MIKIACDICGVESPNLGGAVPPTWTSFNGVIAQPMTDMPTVGISVAAHACELHPNVQLRFVEESA